MHRIRHHAWTKGLLSWVNLVPCVYGVGVSQHATRIFCVVAKVRHDVWTRVRRVLDFVRFDGVVDRGDVSCLLGRHVGASRGRGGVVNSAPRTGLVTRPTDHVRNVLVDKARVGFDAVARTRRVVV